VIGGLPVGEAWSSLCPRLSQELMWYSKQVAIVSQ